MDPRPVIFDLVTRIRYPGMIDLGWASWARWVENEGSSERVKVLAITRTSHGYVDGWLRGWRPWKTNLSTNSGFR